MRKNLVEILALCILYGRFLTTTAVPLRLFHMRDPIFMPVLAAILCSAALWIAGPAARGQTILEQPVSRTVFPGDSVVFGVRLQGNGPYKYQWLHNDTNVPNGIIETVAGNGIAAFAGDGGAGTNASLNVPVGLAMDGAGNLYIADSGTLRVRRLETNGVLVTVAGNGTSGNGGDGGPATNASFRSVAGIAVDSLGNLYVADEGDNRVRKVDLNGVIRTVAGNGADGYGGDGGQATHATLTATDVAVDQLGNLYISDTSLHLVRKVGTNGVITTIAGTGSAGFSGDGGPGTNAQLNFPYDLAVDNLGSLLISDRGNERIRKVDANGVIVTIAGNGTSVYGGDGSAALNSGLAFPRGLAADRSGAIYVSEGNRGYIRRISADGIITTAAGNGTRGYSGDGGLATNATVGFSLNVALDRWGRLFISDRDSQRVRRVTFSDGPSLRIEHVQAGDLGNYRVIVSSGGSGVSSATATLAYAAGPRFLGIDGAHPPDKGGLLMRVQCSSTQSLVLQASTNLRAGEWFSLQTSAPPAEIRELTDRGWTNSPARFYRIRVE